MRYLIIILSFLMVACNTTTVTQERLPLEIPSAPELKMRPVKWEIHDSMICLRPDQYSNLSLNAEDIKSFIQYQNKVIDIYNEYYKKHDTETVEQSK